MEFIFPKDLRKLILIKVLKLKYYEKKKKILKLFTNYIIKFKVKKHYRKNWNMIPENKRIIYWTDIYINRYIMRTGSDFPVNPQLLYNFCEKLARENGLLLET